MEITLAVRKKVLKDFASDIRERSIQKVGVGCFPSMSIGEWLQSVADRVETHIEELETTSEIAPRESVKCQRCHR